MWRCWVPCWNSASMKRHCTPRSARMRPELGIDAIIAVGSAKTNISMHWHRLWRTVARQS